jgi:hypothetical protein
LNNRSPLPAQSEKGNNIGLTGFIVRRIVVEHTNVKVLVPHSENTRAKVPNIVHPERENSWMGNKHDLPCNLSDPVFKMAYVFISVILPPELAISTR